MEMDFLIVGVLDVFTPKILARRPETFTDRPPCFFAATFGMGR
jgi:hypothetical protein